MKKYRKYNKYPWDKSYSQAKHDKIKAENELNIAIAQAKILQYNASGYLQASRKYMAILRWAWTRPINSLNNEIVFNKMIKAGLYKPRNFWRDIVRPVVPRKYKTI